ncbi:MAG TPA: hypothetical protein VL793_13705 [Patescibacteria group bacterium]|nr:hypothetical protein [Patescibacteria group bacterium]
MKVGKWSAFLLPIFALINPTNAPSAPTNSWTKPTSGYWDEPFWSLGELPSIFQGAIMFTNSGFKALAIGSGTTATNASSLTIQNLIVSAPAGSSNQLLLNYPGQMVSFGIQSNFVVGPFASLVSYFSASHAGALLLRGPASASFSEQSFAFFANIFLGDSGSAGFSVSNASISAGTLTMGRPLIQIPGGSGNFLLAGGSLQTVTINLNRGTFTQTGGTNFGPTINVPSAGDTDLAEYNLSDGVLVSQQVTLGGFPSGTFNQSGGLHTNSGSMTLWGFDRSSSHTVWGRYNLDGGRLFSQQILINGGSFNQTGGTNRIQEVLITDDGGFSITGGSLSISNVSVLSDDSRGFYSSFLQSGGTSSVQRFVVAQSGSFALHAGTFSASNIIVGVSNAVNPQAPFRAIFAIQGGVITNPGTFLMFGGDVAVRGQVRLGRLDIAGGTSSLGFQAAGTVVRFLDSHLEVLGGQGTVSILSWNGSTNGGGSTQLYVGTTAQGLTVAQLARIRFVNPQGLPTGTYPARILTTGEVVPGPRPIVNFTKLSNAIVLSWSGNYQLLTTTNIILPFIPIVGATSPYTNLFTDAQRFFELGSPQ